MYGCLGYGLSACTIKTGHVKYNTNSFSYVKHRWCLWYFSKKVPRKYMYKGLIFLVVHVLVYNSQNVEEFEVGWKTMIDK